MMLIVKCNHEFNHECFSQTVAAVGSQVTLFVQKSSNFASVCVSAKALMVRLRFYETDKLCRMNNRWQ